MADFPDDASPSAAATRRNTAPFPPFVAPKSGAGVAPRASRQITSVPGGRVPPGRLYTPPGVPAISMASATPLEAETPAREPSSPDSATFDVPPIEPPPVSATEPSEFEPETPVASEYTAYAAAPTDQRAEPDEVEAGAVGHHPVAEEDNDDWFAAEVSESDAPHEAAAPTPAFNDLYGIERLASDAAADGEGDADAAYDMSPEPASATEPSAPDPRASVADLLERVALRVRDGELAIPSDVASSNDAAALAAVLTALLRTPQE